MSGHPVSVGDRADAAQFKHELLGRLGLRDDANKQDVEAAHNVLAEFLELAPRKVNSWAEARTADMDEAFALLSGPEQRLISASQRAARTRGRLDETPERHTAAPVSLTAPTAPPTRKPRWKQIVWAIVPLLLIAVVLGVYYMDKASEVPGISGTPTGQETTAAAGAATKVDQAKLAALMQKISTNPKDVASLQAIGNLYFAATDYKNAIVWEQKILGFDPKNQVALLALGAGQFNLGNAVEAKKQWLIAAGLYPNVAEVHYDLGFLYFSQTPPDTANMTAEWSKVVAIDPNSALAKTVANHLKSSTPSASATPSAK
jgi:tetratricopeptide (TPR) repeat protein